MHGADLVEWLLVVLARGGSREIYNVGSDQAISIADLAHTVRKVLGARSEIVIQMPTDPSHPPSRYVPSVRKATLGLGLSMKIGLEAAVRATANDWKVRKNVL